MNEILALSLFAVAVVVLLAGYPVAFTLAGVGLSFALLGMALGHFDASFLAALPERIYGVMTNGTLVAIPLFVFMGVMLERSKLAEDLLNAMAQVLSKVRGGLALSVCLVGGILAASTGIVGATVVTMGLISLPTMLKRGYSARLSSGIVCASGTLGQIIPPSIVLVILGDIISSAYQQSQLDAGNFSPRSISVGDLFIGALVPGSLLMVGYMAYIVVLARLCPSKVPEHDSSDTPGDASTQSGLLRALLPPLLLMSGVLGSILSGAATPTEAASVGAVGALLLAKLKRGLTLNVLRSVMRETTRINAMVFTILIGASIFSLVFRGYGGDEMIQAFLTSNSGGLVQSFVLVMAVMFLLGFFLDFFEITFVIVPLVAPGLLTLGVDPIWLGVMIAINLQTSFLTPPFGFSLFYLRGVAPNSVSTGDIYRGAIPFIGIQLTMLLLLWFFPELVTWLPEL